MRPFLVLLLLPATAALLPSILHGQEVFAISRVPLAPDGDGFVGYVDFRARATCAGADPGLQMAVDRIVVEGIRYGDAHHDEVPGFTFPMELSKGLLHVRGDIRDGQTLSGTFAIQPGSVLARLEGFLDWLVIEEGYAPHDMKCSEWTDYADRYFAPTLSHSLEIHRADNLGDGLFFRVKEAVDDLAGLEQRIETLEADLARAASADEYASVLRRVTETEWPDRNGTWWRIGRRAEDVEESARAGLARTQEGEEQPQAEEEVKPESDRSERPSWLGGGDAKSAEPTAGDAAEGSAPPSSKPSWLSGEPDPQPERTQTEASEKPAWLKEETRPDPPPAQTTPGRSDIPGPGTGERMDAATGPLEVFEVSGGAGLRDEETGEVVLAPEWGQDVTGPLRSSSRTYWVVEKTDDPLWSRKVLLDASGRRALPGTYRDIRVDAGGRVVAERFLGWSGGCREVERNYQFAGTVTEFRRTARIEVTRYGSNLGEVGRSQTTHEYGDIMGCPGGNDP